MEPSYFDLLSPEPIYIQGVGGILSPKLADIASIGFQTYQYYLTILQMGPESYFTMIGRPELYEGLSEEEGSGFQMFDLFTMNDQSARILQNLFDFFLKEKVLYSPPDRCFPVQDDSRTIGRISRENYGQICSLILQRNSIKTGQKEDLSGIKNRKAREIMKKLQKGRQERSRQTKSDKNMELGNIISAVANKSHSLSILNIWELTVFQLWDCFIRLSNNSIYDIQSMSVAAWGSKDRSFDAAAWYKRIDNGN